MKWISRFAPALIILSIAYSPAFATNQQIIYGLDHASELTSQAQTEFYIQANSFLDQNNAQRYKQMLESKTTYPVTITQHKKFYVVSIGPIPNSADVRKTANTILENKKSVAETKTSSQPAVTPDPPAATKQESYKPIANTTTTTPSNANWYLSVGAGVASPTLKKNIYIANDSGAPSPYNQDQYSTRQRNQPLFAIAAGRRWKVDSVLFPTYSLGLYYQHSFATNVGKQITQYSDPDFTNYKYNWDISSDMLLATIKLNLINLGNFSPYLMGGVGGAMNRADSYSEEPYSGLTATRNSAGFSTHTSTNFAYNVGAGVDYQASQQFILSAEYQYQHLGKMTSGNGASSWSGQSLNLGTYHDNALLLNITYLLEK